MQLADVRQTHNSDCGWAAAEVVLQYFSVFKHRDLVVQLLGVDSVVGTNPKAIEIFFRHEGFSVVAGNMQLEDLKFHLKNGRPIITPVTLTNNIGHYIVVKEIARGKVYYHCPSYGPQSMPIDLFIQSWYDTDGYGNDYKQYGIAIWK